MAYIISLLWYVLLFFAGNAEKTDSTAEVNNMIKSKSAVEKVSLNKVDYKLEKPAESRDKVEVWKESEPEPELD